MNNEQKEAGLASDLEKWVYWGGGGGRKGERWWRYEKGGRGGGE